VRQKKATAKVPKIPKKAPQKTGGEPAAESTVVPVSAGLAKKIRELDAALEAEFGCDFAFGIAGGGGVVAASNSRDGIVPPVVKPDPPGGRVYDLDELKALPLNTAVGHPVMGSGRVVPHPDDATRTAVRFMGVGLFDFVSGEHSPWSEPIVVKKPEKSD
jgi:hypothetical protein